MTKPQQHICLNMIVKNESHVIERCLASVKGLISSWAVVDTGSTDGTQEKIRQYLKDIPGHLVERPWQDFAHNRTEALEFVTQDAEYILFVDADEEIKFDPGFEFPILEEDCYFIQSRINGMHYYRMQLVKNGLGWRWESKLHEYITSEVSRPPKVLAGIYDLPHPDGFRSSNPNKYKQDAITLEQAVLDEPDNERYVFYLAQSYRDCGDYELAIRYYTKRVQMGGWQEEVWYALYQIAVLKMLKGEAWEVVQMGLLDAYNFRPSRAESLLIIIEYYRKKNAWPLAYFFARQAVQIPYPKDVLFIGSGAYGPQIWLELAYAAFGINKWDETIAICNAILADRGRTPEISQQTITLRLAAQEAKYPKRVEPLSIQRKYTIIIECDGLPDLHFDDCVNSLRYQQYNTAGLIFVAAEKNKHAISERLHGLNDVEIFTGDLLSAINSCTKEAYVVLLGANARFTSDQALSLMNQALNERPVEVLYGQHLYANGQYGNAFPYTSTHFFTNHKSANSHSSWCVFKPSMFKIEKTDQAPTDKTSIINLLLNHTKESGYAFFLEPSLITVNT